MQLAYCQKCGGAPRYFRIFQFKVREAGESCRCRIECAECGSMSMNFESLRLAGQDWNAMQSRAIKPHCLGDE